MEINGQSVELPAVVFSLHPAVRTNLYSIGASSSFLHTKLGRPRKPTSTLPDPQELLQKCRRLLHKVYLCEMNWQPDPNALSQFKVIDGQLCDRFDETAVWIVILASNEPNAEAIACYRILSEKLATKGENQGYDVALPSLDILGYDGCPAGLHEWIRSKEGDGHAVEGQRIAVDKEFRRWFLLYHLFHVTAQDITEIAEAQPFLFDPETMIIASVPYRMQKYMKCIGGHQPDESWTICYEEADKSAPLAVFLIPMRTRRPHWMIVLQAILLSTTSPRKVRPSPTGKAGTAVLRDPSRVETVKAHRLCLS